MKANAIAADFATRAEELGGTVEFAHGGSGFAVVSGLTADAAVALGGEEDVAAVEADVTVAADPIGLRGADLAVAGWGAADPATATRYSRQWNMHVIRADRAWATGRFGSPAVRVGILDSGIDYLHPELVGLVDLSR